jgi:hypothetical protein
MTDFFALLGGSKTLIALLIPLSAFVSNRLYALYTRYRILGFGADELDVVLPASDGRPDPVVGFTRPTIGIGSVRALGVLARAIGRYYRRLPLNVHFASRVDARLGGDVVAIGGPRANRVSAEILASQPVIEVANLSFDDVHRSLRMDGFNVAGYDTDQKDGVPRRDLGILLICASPFSVRRRRAVLCCGFTSYGTAGAAQWFFSDVLNDSLSHPLARSCNIPRRRMPAGSCYVAVLEFRISSGTVIGSQVLFSKLYRATSP